MVAPANWEADLARRAKAEKATDGGEPTGVEAIRGNGFDPTMTAEFLDRIMNLHGDLATEQSKYMLECKTIRGDMAVVYDEAKDKGIPKKALKAAVKKRILERKIENIREDFEGDDLDNYDLVLQALGDLGDTPLGAAALAKTGNGAEHAHQ